METLVSVNNLEQVFINYSPTHFSKILLLFFTFVIAVIIVFMFYLDVFSKMFSQTRLIID